MEKTVAELLEPLCDLMVDIMQTPDVKWLSFETEGEEKSTPILL